MFHPEQDRIVSVRECARAQVSPLWRLQHSAALTGGPFARLCCPCKSFGIAGQNPPGPGLPLSVERVILVSHPAPPAPLLLAMQGFPDKHRFVGNVHNKHRQVGNAVVSSEENRAGGRRREQDWW